MKWQLAEAKNKFSEVVKRALSEGPQQVTRPNESVVILSLEDYEKLTGKHPSFKDFLLSNGPSFEGLDLSRDRSPMRDHAL